MTFLTGFSIGSIAGWFLYLAYAQMRTGMRARAMGRPQPMSWSRLARWGYDLQHRIERRKKWPPEGR